MTTTEPTTKANEKTEPNGDCRNEDGILICGRCKKPLERRIPAGGIFDKPHLVPSMCDCQKEEERRKREEAEKREKEQAEKRLRASCFASSGRYALCTFASDDGRNPEQSTICKAYAATFDGTDASGLILFGDCGTGKSFHAACIANAVIESGHTCRVTDIKQVVNLMESSFEKRMENLSRILSPDLLILEDLGAQRSTEYVMEHVYDVVDGRYKSGKPMVITTNFPFRRMLEAEKDDPWQRVFDRIVECCYPVHYEGASRRREKGLAMRRQLRKKLGIEVES